MRRRGTRDTALRYSDGMRSTTVVCGRDLTSCSPSAMWETARLGCVLKAFHGQARLRQPRMLVTGCDLPLQHRIRGIPASVGCVAGAENNVRFLIGRGWVERKVKSSESDAKYSPHAIHT